MAFHPLIPVHEPCIPEIPVQAQSIQYTRTINIFPSISFHHATCTSTSSVSLHLQFPRLSSFRSSAPSSCCHIPVPPFLFPSCHLRPLHLSVFLFLPYPYSLIFHNCAPDLFRHIPVPAPACQRSAPVISWLYFACHILRIPVSRFSLRQHLRFIPYPAAALHRIAFFQR